ncbi:Nicotinamide mononucleotide adenylyltransferase [Fasciola hepatica]|uniref:Nicotinamide mononucleotide adenylyltransferase n=1 Tax=Fasciola hepatica TaxID=6192 RepID=A0A4E0R4E5_FASHE|nr:Nicotinamide mononucleotide adenylyltransferase [Fasciola hepatica]
MRILQHIHSSRTSGFACLWFFQSNNDDALANDGYLSLMNCLLLIVLLLELARDKLERSWSISKAHWNSSSAERSTDITNQTTGPNMNVCSKCEADDVIPRRQVVVGGVFSPVSDAYNKAGLAPAHIRVELVRTACVTASDWLRVNPWESQQSQWTRTRAVLDQLQSVLDTVYDQMTKTNSTTGITNQGEWKAPQPTYDKDKPGLLTESWLSECLTNIGFPCTGPMQRNHTVGGARVLHTTASVTSRNSSDSCVSQEPDISLTFCPRPKVKLVCGADLLESFAVPNLWAEEDIEVIVRDYGLVCISRPQSNAAKFVCESELLSKYESNVVLVTDWCQNALSSTMVRRSLALGRTVRYLVPDDVLEKIYELGLYKAKRPPYCFIRRNPQLCTPEGRTVVHAESLCDEHVNCELDQK